MFGEANEETIKIVTSELPSKRLGDLFVTLLEGDEALGQSIKVGEVIGSYDLALNHREVDLDWLSQEA